MALIFGAVLGGALVIDYGVKNFSSAAGASGTSTPATTAGAPAATTTTAQGSVTRADLLTIGSRHKWGSGEVNAWNAVIGKESGGNPKAINPSSGAAGIAQFINGFSEYATYGGDANSVTGQLTAMANYISQRYGTPSAALQHENTYGWY
jgi:hypothetical protein